MSMPTMFFFLVEVVVGLSTVLTLRTVLSFDARGALGATSALPTSRRVFGAQILCAGSTLLCVGLGWGRALTPARILS